MAVGGVCNDYEKAFKVKWPRGALRVQLLRVRCSVGTARVDLNPRIVSASSAPRQRLVSASLPLVSVIPDPTRA